MRVRCRSPRARARARVHPKGARSRAQKVDLCNILWGTADALDEARRWALGKGMIEESEKLEELVDLMILAIRACERWPEELRVIEVKNEGKG